MPFHGNLLRGLGDIITDIIPGGDVIDSIASNLLGNPSGDQLLAGAGNRADVIVGGPGGGPVRGRQEQLVNAVAHCEIELPLSSRVVAACPPGYVAVDKDGDGITDTCMRKEVARACHLWKPRPKAILTASDRRSLNRATAVMKRVDTVVKQTNELRGQARLTKATRKRK